MSKKKSGSVGERLAQRDQLIEKYHRFVHAIAGKMIHAMGLPAELHEEYVSSGYIGLIEAAERFNPSSGVEFKSFAYLRIRGAIIDNIRSNSQLSGKAYRCARALQAAHQLRENDFETQVARGGNEKHSLEDILDFAAKGALAHRLTWADAEKELGKVVDDNLDPERAFELKENNKKFRSIVETLPEKERLIVEEYYFRGKSFVEIADEHQGLSKSWVSRLHSRALELLRQKLLEDESAQVGASSASS